MSYRKSACISLTRPGIIASWPKIPSESVIVHYCTVFIQLNLVQWHIRYTNSSTEIPEFPIPPEIALELLMAANFLDC